MNHYDLIIAGSGMSGISLARWSRYKIKVLEKSKYIGGCWLNKSYQNVRLQTSKSIYNCDQVIQKYK